MIWGRIKMGNKEHQASHWQKIVRPAESGPNGGEPPGWIRRYLDLADLLIRRVQRRMERTKVSNPPTRRDAA
jgi:hypothetical protein